MPQSETEKSTILIVDDNPENLAVLTRILTSHGYQVRAANNGQMALKALKRILPDLILLDIIMPGMDGYEVCRQLKADEATSDIPVIFITFLTGLEEKIKGFEVGGVDYITKPFQYQEVLVRVNSHLANRKLQQQLQEEYARFQTLADATFEGIIIHDQQKIFEVNQAIEEMSGYPRSTLIGNDPLLFVAPKWREIARQYMHTADGQPYALGGQHYDGRQLSLEWRVKPIVWKGQKVLVSAVWDVSQRMMLEQENLTLRTTLNTRDRFGELVGKSMAMRKIYERIVKAAASDETVVIYGETGTGKELAARMIFTLSQQHAKEFVAVNCGALQESLFEAQFFGYRKGAFTGADRNTRGYFDQAEGGTLFLDEVGELTLAMQVKLLRVLEDGTYTPLGATTSRTADVRIISATNRELRALKEAGEIRDDFFHRLHVITLEMPPLRHHKEDIPLLIEHFLMQQTPSEAVSRRLPDYIVERFCAYDWPGNVRELFNELRRYLATGEIELNEQSSMEADTSRKVVTVPGERPFHEIIEEVEKQLITEALAKNEGNKVKTAEMLQIPLRSLHRKITKFDLR